MSKEFDSAANSFEGGTGYDENNQSFTIHPDEAEGMASFCRGMNEVVQLLRDIKEEIRRGK